MWQQFSALGEMASHIGVCLVDRPALGVMLHFITAPHLPNSGAGTVEIECRSLFGMCER